MTVSAATTVGQVLTSAYVNNNINSGLVYVTSATIGTSVASVTLSNAFNSTYDNYRVIVSGGVNTVASGANLVLGSSVADYYSAQVSCLYSADGTSYTRTNGGASWANVGSAFADGLALDVVLFNPFLAKFTGLAIGSRTDYRTAGAMSVGGGYHAVASSFSALTFSAGVGFMTGGTISVYGFRKA